MTRVCSNNRIEFSAICTYYYYYYYQEWAPLVN